MNPSILFCAVVFSCLRRFAFGDDPSMKYDESVTMNCFPANCGNIKNITFPFWVDGQQPSYCGFPFFKLSCAQNIPILVLYSENYRVERINYEEQSVVLANTKFYDTSICQVVRESLPNSLPPFAVSPLNQEIDFLFHCSKSQPKYSYNIPCANDTFVHLGGSSSYSCQTATMPVLDPLDGNASNYLKHLQNGFLANWTVSTRCNACRESNGQCGYNKMTDNFMCICPDRTHWASCSAGKSLKREYILIIGSVAGFLFVCLSLVLYFRMYAKSSNSVIFCGGNLTNNQNTEAFLEEYGPLAPKRYTYSQVKKTTKAFQEKLGQGGFGSVFKGTLSDGHVVAVKILKDSKGDGEEFRNEVASIGRTSHVNIVSLLGFCSEGSKRALIYDYMCNGSLDKLLYSKKPKTSLDWEKLFQISIGIARGLEYLHRGCNTRIVHFDIKPHNILLDEEFCPKISDFGLAKLCLLKESIISIAGARGTIGYIAPEVFSRNFGVVSSKSDVYSYGMMVLEIAEGRKNPNDGAQNSSEMYFPHWIYEQLDQKGDLLACGVTAESEDIVRKMILVGLWCIQTMPQNRPSMSRVIEMLEGGVNDLQVPPKPYLSASPLGPLTVSFPIQDISEFNGNVSSVHL